MKAWPESERGGSGVDGSGAVRTRDRFAYGRLRKVLSKEFMVRHWYVLDRDRKLPHELTPKKACDRCGLVKKNDYKEFQPEPFGEKKLGRRTTSGTCRTCIGQATSAGLQLRLESERAARAALDESGQGLWERKDDAPC